MSVRHQSMTQHAHLIYQLEELAANAWPARITQTVNGWRLRYTDGITRRANSVWPNLRAADEHSLDEQIAIVEDFYAQRDLPARFQICPAARPANLEQILDQKGYTDDATTNVQTTLLTNILGKIEPDLGVSVTINHHLTTAWANAYDLAEGHSGLASQVRRDIMQRIAPSTGFASIHVADQQDPVATKPAAIGLGVVERGWLGVFCMATDPNFRRRGFASQILGKLARWANQQGATNAYLQVMVENEAAQKVYSRYGFSTVYQYHYREKEQSCRVAK